MYIVQCIHSEKVIIYINVHLFFYLAKCAYCCCISVSPQSTEYGSVMSYFFLMQEKCRLESISIGSKELVWVILQGEVALGEKAL